MFNFFNKSKENNQPQVKVSELPELTTTKYPTVVEEIHNEFFTAGEKILCEATSLLKELETKDIQKGKRLAAIGFGKTREAVAAVETENKLGLTKQISELVVYYKTKYPNNKFITEEQVKQICEKYGLVCGDTSMYKGFVPESKLKMIESFEIKENYAAAIVDSWHDNEVVGILNREDIVQSHLIDMLKNGDSWYVVCGDKIKTDHVKNGERFRYLGRGLDSGEYQNQRYLKAVPFKEIKLKICAPLKDMEIPRGKEVVGYKIQNIPDPVVLHPVLGGYLIICAWGNEASDELVVNETMN